MTLAFNSDRPNVFVDRWGHTYYNYLVFTEFSVLVLELLGLSHVWKNAGNSVEDLVIHVPLSAAWSRRLSLFL